MTDNPFQPPASAPAPATDPYAPLRDALAAWPRQAIPLALKMIGLYLVVVVSIVLCFVPALFVVPLVGWTASRVLLGTADGHPPIPWDRMTLRRLWPTGAALTVLGGGLTIAAVVPALVTLMLPYPASLVATLSAGVAAWPLNAFAWFTMLRWADDDHEEITALRALTDAGRLMVGHARTWAAIFGIAFAIDLPGTVFGFKRSADALALAMSGGTPLPGTAHPIDYAATLVSLMTLLWSWLALARLYRVAHPAQPPAASTTAAQP